MKIWLPVIRAGSGTDVFTRRLAEALGRYGVSAEITWFPKRYEFAPFLLRSFPPPPGTQIIHTNSWSGFAFARVGIPLLVTEHLNVLDSMSRRYKSHAQRIYHQLFIRRFMHASFQAAARVTAVSHFVASSLARTFQLQAQAIYNWIDTQLFHPVTESGTLSGYPFRLLFVGNLSRRKGADLLGRIMEELGPDFVLHLTLGPGQREMTGMTPNMVPLKRMARDQDLVAAYHQCDTLLLPTRFEGFGLSAVEAMACGKPIVATDCCSLPEVVADGIGGILCPMNDIRAFAAACRRLAHDGAIKAKLSSGARQRAENLFAEDRIIPQYVTLYEKLLK
jgi:glycosyltransferase involved in cell wall biosynthesis